MFRRYTSNVQVLCELYGQSFNSKGITSHHRWHERIRREEDIDSMARRTATEQAVGSPQFPTLRPWVEHQRDSVADQAVDSRDDLDSVWNAEESFRDAEDSFWDLEDSDYEPSFNR
ncbi:hypothetical protein EIP86_007561 [Pleurotus ostreatoroseus]|nr:hypothetical protein EIP86_007561 [Pleurotus ostreatoroseus]